MSMFAELYTPPLDGRYIGHLVAYLKFRGWSTREYSSWIEMYGEADSEGEPLLLVLPRDWDSPETSRYIAKAVSLMSTIDGEPESLTSMRIQNYHSDVIVIRNCETGSYSSIPIKVAKDQINQIQNIISSGVRAERDPRPYHFTQSSPQRLLDQFRFGHTMRGSFALTVEAAIVHDMELFVQKVDSERPPLFPDIGDFDVSQEPITRSPIERRVVERIMRGLALTRQATAESSIEVVVREYGSGFNGNMCDSFAKLTKSASPIEYGVLWSPRVTVADDLQFYAPVRLDDSSYPILREAAEEMKRRQPEDEQIRGIVTHIGSNVPPLSEGEGGREVIIDWIRGDNQRRAKIIVPISRENYVLASDAHIRWSTVEVTGKVVRGSSSYRLIDARDFKVLN